MFLVGQGQVGRTAAEETAEDILEVDADFLEGLGELFGHGRIDFSDDSPQFFPRFFQVIALAVVEVPLFQSRLVFVFSCRVDGPQGCDLPFQGGDLVVELFQRAFAAALHGFLAAQALHGQPFFVMADIALVFFPLDVGSVAALLPILMAPAQVVDDAIQVLALFQRLIAGLIKSLFGLVAADRIGFFQGNIFRQFCQQAGRFFLAAAQIPAALGQGLFLYRQFLLPFVMLAQLVVAMAGLFCQFGYGNLPFRQGLAALGGFGLGSITGVLPLLDIGSRPRFHIGQGGFLGDQPGLHVGPFLFQGFDALVKISQGLADIGQALLFLTALPAGLFRSLAGFAPMVFGLGQFPGRFFGLLAQFPVLSGQGFQALLATARMRPDLLAAASITPAERRWLSEQLSASNGQD